MHFSEVVIERGIISPQRNRPPYGLNGNLVLARLVRGGAEQMPRIRLVGVGGQNCR